MKSTNAAHAIIHVKVGENARGGGVRPLFTVDSRPKTQFAPGEREKPNPNATFKLDLTAALTPGPHAIVISAPRDGFALDGVLRYAKEAVPLATDSTWQVMRFPPTVILEDEAWMQPTFNGTGAPVVGGETFKAESDFASIAVEGLARRTVAQYDDTLWQLGLLAHKGIVIRDGHAYGWGSAARAHSSVVLDAKAIYLRTVRLAGRIDKLRGDAASVPAETRVAGEVQEASR